MTLFLAHGFFVFIIGVQVIFRQSARRFAIGSWYSRGSRNCMVTLIPLSTLVKPSTRYQSSVLAQSRSLGDIGSPSSRIQNNYFKPEPKSELPVLGIFLVYFSVPSAIVLVLLAVDFFVSFYNRHDHCHHYHCQYTIIAGSQASGFNLYMCSCHACLFFCACLLVHVGTDTFCALLRFMRTRIGQ
ncbi:hypothetical protein BDW68DRAFT_118125 [Aspergillus falconensis]